jgi:hypothetical protein
MSTAEQSREYRKHLTEEQKKRIRELNKERTKRYRKNNPDRTRASRRKYEQKNKDYVNLRHKKYYWSDPVKSAFRNIRSKYKITKEEFDAKLKSQDGKCAICQVVLDKPHFDHNHTTGKNRDLLCRFCNLVLGNAHDSIQVLKNAVEYLIKHGEENGEERGTQQEGSSVLALTH